MHRFKLLLVMSCAFNFQKKNTCGLTSGLSNIPRGERKGQEGIGVGRRVTPPLTFKPDRGK